MPGRIFQGQYRFGFNGQEKDYEIEGEGNLNTALFWEYDTRLGRRWNIDPVMKASHSRYSAFGNTPILFSDVDGDTWDKDNGSDKKAEEIESKADDQLDKINAKMAETQSKITTTTNNKELSKLNKSLTNLNEKAQEIKDLKTEMNEMKNDPNNVYSLVERPAFNNDHLGEGSIVYRTGSEQVEGGRTYFKDGKTVMEYNNGDMQAAAHELKHGYQFKVGQIGYNPVADKDGRHNAGDLTDKNDEIAAFRRGSAFDPRITDPVLKLSVSDLGVGMFKSYGGLPPENLTTYSTYEQVRIANGRPEIKIDVSRANPGNPTEYYRNSENSPKDIISNK